MRSNQIRDGWAYPPPAADPHGHSTTPVPLAGTAGLRLGHTHDDLASGTLTPDELEERGWHSHWEQVKSNSDPTESIGVSSVSPHDQASSSPSTQVWSPIPRLPHPHSKPLQPVDLYAAAQQATDPKVCASRQYSSQTHQGPDLTDAIMISECAVDYKLSRSTLFWSECPFCGRFFRRHHGLLAHLPIHTGNHPFKCRYCGQRFSRRHDLERDALARHLKSTSGRGCPKELRTATADGIEEMAYLASANSAEGGPHVIAGGLPILPRGGTG